MSVLGVVMAGGQNTRYGGLKAFAEVGDRRIVERVIDALEGVTKDLVLIANDKAAYVELGLPMRSDEVPGAAALGGLLTALRWADELGLTGIVTVACDMPFVTSTLLQEMREVFNAKEVDIVIPQSDGPRGVEPLCAFYSTRCISAIEKAIARSDLRMISFHDDVRVTTLPVADADVLFMNVNTPEELERARAVARG